ncbi:hypothetical protein Rsub_01246 [Raphidocelis subcapitata]|uniref:Uncharacterized protein n=1 Tax=Raphidocelis subcapitata TaxID=307507 RepID=A0A2V0NM42_9CHLO|nr:hypothetical protein Rsub_01246 [Raphidocelis subcapitata]|eukprot:GBF88531.1 hypothetical protein Rsub_01246 [Raphidocelis subcapitata]
MEDDGFGSPVAAGAVPASPQLLHTPANADTAAFTFSRHPSALDRGRAAAASDSPLVFQRTPSSPAGLRFESWMSSTDKYRGRALPRTPQSDVSSVLDADAVPPSPALSSARLMRRWLGATDSGNWTPGATPAAGSDAGARRDQATPGARTPATAPRGATPATDVPRSRPLRDLRADGSDSDGEEAATAVKLPPSARSPSLVGSPAPPPAAGPSSLRQAAAAAPVSPLEKVIDLMMGPPSPGLVLQPKPQRGPALGAAAAVAAVDGGAPTPEERVIDLMLRPAPAPAAPAAGAWREGAADSDSDGGGSGGGEEESSDDEIEVGELEALCAEAAAAGAGDAVPDLSPINEIIGLVLASTPSMSARGSARGGTLTRGGAAAAAAAAAVAAADAAAAATAKEDESGGAGPRVLFAD